MKGERKSIRKEIFSLKDKHASSLPKKLLSIKALLREEETSLSNEEFIILISLFDEKTSLSISSRIFSILLEVKLSEAQLSFLFDSTGKKREEDSLYWEITWIFLDKPLSVKRPYTLFLKKLIKKAPELSLHAAKLFHLLIFEDIPIIKARSYSGLLWIRRHELQDFDKKKKKKFLKTLRSIGKEALQGAKAAWIKDKRKKSEVIVKAKKIKNFIRIRIRLGRKIRRESVTIKISDKKEKLISTKRKHLFFYATYSSEIQCKIFSNEKVLFEKVFSF
ncbi:hypothetical protein NEFER03_0938 [Nematocida sp. LUAm3]|nr:hypothetical protein NEFER03_0938 [Nematocida sp. LUAm3]KAI5174956.1 hypothetical protein NEFER02_1056 [Nematocida sp. LUAm2]KAI5177445.1 hypothetical protein NEFER01_0695 [Nematocida sp. LUAm1]